MKFLLFPVITAALTLANAASVYAQQIDLARLFKNGGGRVELEDGTAVIRYRDNEPFVPASILKVATTYCALKHLGRDYRFLTPFFSDETDTLYIKGSGDPSLVSEELSSIASKIASKMPRIERIVIDPSLFSPEIEIDGSSSSTNPYDSKVAAFVGNFSSASLIRRRDGVVLSSEAHTPLTPLAREAGVKIPRGSSQRINLGHSWRVGTLYGGELLAAFLKDAGARGAMRIEIGAAPLKAKQVYQHSSSQDLASIARGLLKYSTNFTANQIFLTLGVARFGAPATVAKSQRAMTECLQRDVGWSDFYIEEGSGLSRKNQVTATQMTQLLRHFEPFSDLLNEEQGFTAKTGSLRGVNTLAGYFDLTNGSRARFAILVNSPVDHLYKFRVANELREYLGHKNP